VTSLHPVILTCWLVLAACVLVVGYLMIALCLDWWERRIHATNRQHLTQHWTED
jgi:hypothetical protein